VDNETISAQPDKTKAKRDDEETQYERDLDHWILCNEDWLRDRKTAAQSDDKTHKWTTGLVLLGHSHGVFPGSVVSDQYRKITRPKKMDGFTCLDAKRSPHIYIQPNSNLFKKKLDELTKGQLKGLDWSNVFVAGGIVLGSLLCVEGDEAIHNPAMWKSSDIDIYTHGLNPIESNKRIEHIFQVFKQNLPDEIQDSIIVVKNSKTITFLPPYPYRRFQIILKLVKNPAEVLLNFDLDICAMGYDGKELWMLPRAARALESESLQPKVMIELNVE
jgi:hypothetical protein